MKKIIYLLIAFVAVQFTSCSNEVIEVETTGKLYDLEYNVNVEELYEDFGMQDDIREILREQSYALGLTSLIYDSNGNLVVKKFSYEYNYNLIKETFKGLTEGEYTIVSVETLVDPDNFYTSSDWTLRGEDKLSTLEIYQADYEVYWPFVLGVCTNTIQITSNLTIKATPKAIGSLLQLYWIGFDRSSHVAVGFATNDIIECYKLDPMLERGDKFVTDKTSVGYINIRAEKKLEGAELVSVTRYVLEKNIDWQFCFKKNENEGTSTWTYYEANEGRTSLEDGKTYYGGMYFIDMNKACKVYFGDENGFMSWYKSINDETNSTLVPDIYLTWGGNVKDVQNAMKGYTMTLGSDGKAVLMDDGSYEIGYSGKGKEKKISYSFTSATTGLFEADIQYSKSEVSSSELVDYLENKYYFLAQTSGTYMYCTSDYSTYVLFFEIGDNWNVGFVDVNYVSSMPKFEELAFNAIKQIKATPKAKSLKSAEKKQIARPERKHNEPNYAILESLHK